MKCEFGIHETDDILEPRFPAAFTECNEKSLQMVSVIQAKMLRKLF